MKVLSSSPEGVEGEMLRSCDLARYELVVRNFFADVRDLFRPPPLQHLGAIPPSGGPREVLGLWGRDGRCLGLFTSNSPFRVEDDPIVWETIWKNREILHRIVHTHPLGPDGFSETDHQAMVGIVMGLGRDVEFWLVSPSKVFSQQMEFRQGKVRVGPLWELPHKRVSKSVILLREGYLFGPPQWVPLMKRMSNMTALTDLDLGLDPGDF